MSTILLFAIICMVSALVLYSIGVWGEKLVGRLRPWQLFFFWTGLVCDSLGTHLMSRMAGTFEVNLHSISGLVAILLMAVHAIWATLVLVQKQEQAMRNFHRFSIGVWLLWLIPFVGGLIMAMSRS